MSNGVLPLPPGLGWGIKKSPKWSSLIQRGYSGREVRQPLYANPIWEIDFNFSYLSRTWAFNGGGPFGFGYGPYGWIPFGGVGGGQAPGNPTLAYVPGGFFPATTYYVVTSWACSSGESFSSNEVSAAVPASNRLEVTQNASPAAPSDAIGWNVYVGLWSGGEVKQNYYPLPLGSTWKESYFGLTSNPQDLQRLYNVTPIGSPTNLGYTAYDRLLGFYNARQGSFDSFLYADPDDCYANQAIGAGDGTTTTFQLTRTISATGLTEVIQNPFHVAVTLNGVQQSSGYTIGTLGTNNGGVITFASAPASGVVVGAGYSFFYRLRFLEDSLEFNETLYSVWKIESMKTLSVKL